MLPWLSGIGSDVVLTQAISKHTPHFYTQVASSCVLGCKHQESRKIVSFSIIGPSQLPFYSIEI